MKKRSLLVFPAIMVFCGSLSACKIAKNVTDANIDQWYNTATGEIDIKEKVTIDWWTWGGLAADEIFTDIAKTFSTHVCKNITVRYKCISNSTSSYLMTLANSANNLPDIFLIPDTDFYNYAFTGVVWDFSKYVTQNELADIYEEAVTRYMYDTETKLVGKSSNSGLYALPKDISTFSLCYNEKLMKEACRYASKDMGPEYQGETNVKYYNELKAKYFNEKKPMTWDEFHEMGAILKPYCDNAKPKKTVLSHYELNPALFSNNADFFNDEGTESRIEQPQFAASLDFMKSLVYGNTKKGWEGGLMAGSSGSSTTTGYSSFIGQNSIFSFFGPWDCENFWGVTSADPDGMGFDVKLVPVPYGPGADDVYGTEDDGMSTGQIGSAGYCISNKSTTTNLQRAAALKFAKWLSLSEDAQRTLYQKGTQIPNIKSMADEYVNYSVVTTYNGNEMPVNPSNLSAFVDVINGSSETDRVTGRAKSETRILTNDYKTDWGKIVDSIGFWTKQSVTGADLVNAFKKTLQTRIDESNAAIGR